MTRTSRSDHQHHPAGLDIEAEIRMTGSTLRSHQHRLPETLSDQAEDSHQDIQPLLPLQFSEVDVEVNVLCLTCCGMT
ncbi:hypothetical protein ACIA8R_03175 [Nonomuraea sp. NPDC051191]|uniref:hypothetical protein n=1 Tax=Nonomuraea sp. NPDC051191 TaxID=3364372 RepID=UPI0037B5228A